MSIVRSQEDGWTKEMRKHEIRPVFIGGTYIEPLPREQGGKKDHPFMEYPKMLFRAESAMGGPRICDYKTAGDESEELTLLGRGYAVSQEQAIANVGVQETEFARLAANRTYNERWMSDRAKAEAAAIDETHAEHLPAIPETPILRRQKRKPGRKPKAVPVATGEV